MTAPRLKNPLLAMYSFFLLLSSCTVGPDYRKPDVSVLTPADWRWKIAEPKDEVPKGEWWKVFKDPGLDELETGAVADNQSLRTAIARIDESRAAARISRSRFFPELAFNPSFNRQRTSANQPIPIPLPSTLEITSMMLNTYSLPLDLSYEVDLWGRVRRSFEAATSEAQASVADYQNILLALTADVAVNYFLLRSVDAEIMALERNVELQGAAVGILSDRVAVGTISETDLEQGRAELADITADLADIRRRRAEILNALALLSGKAPSSFILPEGNTTVSPPAIPPGLPSDILERRPDIARAERLLHARNARIGVARAAYFPTLRLNGQAGLLSATAEQLFSSDSRIWSIGPGITLPLFTAGRTAAEVSQAEAVYHEALSEYRQTVLAAFKDVEDSLSQIIFFDRQKKARDEALDSAKRIAELARARYDAGKVGYLEVTEAERKSAQQERLNAEIAGQQFAATVRLIKSLGGGWNTGQISP